jgi:hypothetical protein
MIKSIQDDSKSHWVIAREIGVGIAAHWRNIKERWNSRLLRAFSANPPQMERMGSFDKC